MERNLALEFVRVTEAAAIAASEWVGKGDAKAADGAAVDAMRIRFNDIDFSGTVVIGEGSKDEAPELYTGEKIGKGGEPEVDIAVDPLECTDSVAFGRYNAICVAANGPRGSLFSAPDTYMWKIAVGKKARNAIDIDAPVSDNLKNISKAIGKDIEDVTVVVLDRPRHEQLIKDIRAARARVRLITDGDVAGGIAPCMPKSGIDVMMGIGGSTEAVLAAVALKIMGGEILCRFKERDEKYSPKQLELLAGVGLKKETVYSSDMLAKGKDLGFTATGVIDGPLLSGVRYVDGEIITQSVVIRGQSETLRYITTHHWWHKPKVV
ncbi:fructose-bisphosphatase, class II [Candidatus Peribacteria bacterium RIFCSPHIGHO2_01_FULL_49_38]|nr:MAG: fructose-bisphosphatase, class II [Candidatus Peribacteria bacterium RIFCSPHIGHO2_01_FULL_49_38]